MISAYTDLKGVLHVNGIPLTWEDYLQFSPRTRQLIKLINNMSYPKGFLPFMYEAGVPLEEVNFHASVLDNIRHASNVAGEKIRIVRPRRGYERLMEQGLDIHIGIRRSNRVAHQILITEATSSYWIIAISPTGEKYLMVNTGNREPNDCHIWRAHTSPIRQHYWYCNDQVAQLQPDLIPHLIGFGDQKPRSVDAEKLPVVKNPTAYIIYVPWHEWQLEGGAYDEDGTVIPETLIDNR